MIVAIDCLPSLKGNVKTAARNAKSYESANGIAAGEAELNNVISYESANGTAAGETRLKTQLVTNSPMQQWLERLS